MKNKLLITLVAVSLLFSGQSGFAAEKSTAATELNDLITTIQTKLKEGKKTEKVN